MTALGSPPQRIATPADIEAAKINAQAASVPTDWTDEAGVLERVRRAMNISRHAMPAAGKTIIAGLALRGLVESRVGENRRTEYRRVPNARKVKPRTMALDRAARRRAEEAAAAEERRRIEAEFDPRAERYQNPQRQQLENALGEIVPPIIERVLRQHGLIE